MVVAMVALIVVLMRIVRAMVMAMLRVVMMLMPTGMRARLGFSLAAPARGRRLIPVTAE